MSQTNAVKTTIPAKIILFPKQKKKSIPVIVKQVSEIEKDELVDPILIGIAKCVEKNGKKTNIPLSFEQMVYYFRFDFRIKFSRNEKDPDSIWIEADSYKFVQKELYQRTTGSFKVHQLTP